MLTGDIELLKYWTECISNLFRDGKVSTSSFFTDSRIWFQETLENGNYMTSYDVKSPNKKLFPN
ncbi:hypothetical protein ACTXT7_013580 [Hymenolepis weldensis]